MATMKFYVASSISNKDKVQHVFGALRTEGHQVTTDWTLTDDTPEDVRGFKRDYMRSIAKRDFEGIRECDVFVLLSKPSEGRSMYVELGLAMAMHEATGKPSVFVVGPDNNESNQCSTFILQYNALAVWTRSLNELCKQKLVKRYHGVMKDELKNTKLSVVRCWKSSRIASGDKQHTPF